MAAFSEKPLIVFDVNETLLDLETISPVFERVFGDKMVMRFWFANLILYSEALTLAGTYAPFTGIGAAVMEMMGRTRGVKVTDHDKHELTDAFASMPPHPDVPVALKRLRESGFRLFTLTDNLLEVQTQQLEQGGIVEYFERRFSADGARTHKPAPSAYAYLESELGAKSADLLLVASHTWDTLGALGAGWRGALVKRPGNDVLYVGPQPDFVGNDLNDIADQLIACYAAQPQWS
ncbi:MAG TPA: haloacid dehalogenase type II [Verrucomicrobiae bacterium]|nr:haloacid dehalogenase type II [Verrucomicrobiae bacterium]